MMPNLLSPRIVSFALLLTALSSLALADNKPDWLVSPERNGFISVVGYAPKQTSGGSAAQRRVALMKAQQQLAQIVRVRIESTFQHEQLVTNGMATQSSVSSTRVSSSAALKLNNAEIGAQWFDPDNGDLYLLLEVQE